MLRVLNEYVHYGTSPYTTLVLHSSKMPETEVVLDTDHSNVISKLTWCYSQERGLVYATDFSMSIPHTLNTLSPRVFLWKYTLFLRFNKIAKYWHRHDLLDYRTAGLTEDFVKKTIEWASDNPRGA